MAGGSVHAVAWLVWALSAAATVELATNPLYVSLVMAVTFLVVSVHAGPAPRGAAFSGLLAVGVVFGVVRVALVVLTTHGGPDALVTLPHVDLPPLLGGFRVGGTVEATVLWRAAAEALVVVGLMAVFGAFNSVVSHYELLQAAPRAFYEPGLVLTVALAFVPSVVATVQRVREADRARTGGRVVRRRRLVRLMLPVLEGALERALALAESMDSRGFSHGGAGAADRAVGWSVVAALLALVGAFVALVGRAGTVALALGAAAALALSVAVAIGSRRSGRARYRRRPMRGADWVVVLASLVAPVGLAALSLSGDRTLTWAATPLELPGFNPLACAVVLSLAVPSLLSRAGQVRAGSTP